MEEEKRNGCTECVRYGFVLLNGTFLVLGVVLTTLGAWFYSIPASQSLISILFDEEQQRQFNDATLMIVCVGGGVCFAACLSCCGAFAQSRCLLLSIFTTFVALIIAELAFIGFGSIFLEALESEETSAQMAKTLAMNYAGDHATDAESMAWREMQKYFSCCGVNTPLGFENHTNVQYGNFTGSLWYREKNGLGRQWPESCCSVPEDNVSSTACEGMPGNFLNEEGCQTKVDAFLWNHLLSLVVITAATIVCQVIAALLGYRLFKAVANAHKKSVPADSQGYDRFSDT